VTQTQNSAHGESFTAMLAHEIWTSLARKKSHFVAID
jgi:hypothetical protein